MQRILAARCLALILGVVAAGVADGQEPTLVAPANPCTTSAAAQVADSVAAKFDTHQFVFIHATHGTAKIDAFLMCLVSRPSFTSRVTDIVAEWASSAHQSLLDRYLLALEKVPSADLVPVWLDTDTPEMWATMPTLRQLLDTLRRSNAALPALKRIRLIGGNEGIAWAKVQRVEDLAIYPFKTNWMEHLLIEHLAKAAGNRTLVVYGDGHIHHNGGNFMAEVDAVFGRARLFVIGTVHDLSPDERAWLSRAGDIARPFFVDATSVPQGQWPSSLRANGNETSPSLADYVDGVLYLGPESDRVVTGTLPLTAGQRRELDRRNGIRFDGDPQTNSRVRSAGRKDWFRDHPRDIPARP